eukprot:284123-Amphidinium_carterae.1
MCTWHNIGVGVTMSSSTGPMSAWPDKPVFCTSRLDDFVVYLSPRGLKRPSAMFPTLRTWFNFGDGLAMFSSLWVDGSEA